MSEDPALSPWVERTLEWLSLTVVVIVFVYKLPQILKIWGCGHTNSVSLPSVVLEWTAYSIMLTYHVAEGYPFYTYAEHVVTVLSNHVLVVMILHYREQLKPELAPYFATYYCGFLGIALRLFPDFLIYGLFAGTTPMLVWSKVEQLKDIIQAASAGSVSLVTWAICTYMTQVRILTTWLVTQDLLYMVNLSSSQVLNVAITGAILYYDGLKL